MRIFINIFEKGSDVPTIFRFFRRTYNLTCFRKTVTNSLSLMSRILLYNKIQ